MRKKNITWKEPPEVGRMLVPPAHVREVSLDPANKQAIISGLVVGRLFRVVCPMDRVITPRGVSPHKFPALTKGWGYYGSGKHNAEVMPNQIAMYSGLIRVEETGSKGIISAPRHTFIINCARYIVNDLNCVFPT